MLKLERKDHIQGNWPSDLKFIKQFVLSLFDLQRYTNIIRHECKCVKKTIDIVPAYKGNINLF